MKFTQVTLSLLMAGAIFTSCTKDDVMEEVKSFSKDISNIDISNITVPDSYEFSRNNETTVSYGGQTTRLKQVVEIGALMTTVNPVPTQEDFTNRFNLGEGFNNSELNGTGKKIRNKVAASAGLFRTNLTDADAIKEDFDNYLTNQLSVLASTEEAQQGVAGLYDGKRYLNEKGLEYNQAFYKGLIGALAIDQTLNHYFNRLDDDFNGDNSYRTANDAETLAEGANYTTMEHHFDEAYGYVFGAGDEDVLLGKYLGEIKNQSHFANIEENVYKAFIYGRAAVVAKQYEVRDAAVEVLRYQISKIPAARGVYYLQKAKADIDSDDPRAAFHALSEGYGFIYSLQFTYNITTGTPYFTKAEVDTLLNKLYGSTNGFYDLTSEDLEEISEEIVAKYDFTLAQVNM